MRVDLAARVNIYIFFKSPNEKQRGLTIFESIMKNEDLKFQRTLITANSDDSIGIEVLHQISELYLTVCSFAFASNYLELYKHCSNFFLYV